MHYKDYCTNPNHKRIISSTAVGFRTSRKNCGAFVESAIATQGLAGQPNDVELFWKISVLHMEIADNNAIIREPSCQYFCFDRSQSW